MALVAKIREVRKAGWCCDCRAVKPPSPSPSLILRSNCHQELSDHSSNISCKRTTHMLTRVCHPKTGGRAMISGPNQGISQALAKREAKKNP